jgi:AmmeMemoRadiSam system protein A
LRGCIGHILGYEPLKKSIPDMTLAAAFEDTRFPPLSFKEWASVRLHISLLTEPVPVKSYQDIRPGTDGIIVTYGRKKGVYLPEVATETGWSKERFLSELCSQKAGLPPDAWQKPGVTLEVFTADVFGEKEE